MSVTPFRVDVSEDVLADLRDRIRRTRFTPASSPEPWAAGTDPAYLRSLLTYWADGFDWRTAEDELNRLPHHLADVGGQRIQGDRHDRLVVPPVLRLAAESAPPRRPGARGGHAERRAGAA
jgi:Epoxide hydrolase N terminus